MRKPGETVQINLRIREGLRRRLESEAKRRGVSMNYEMISRIEHTFEAENARTFDRIAHDMDAIWARYGERFLQLDLVDQLRQALETIKQSGPDSEETQIAVDRINKLVFAELRRKGDD